MKYLVDKIEWLVKRTGGDKALWILFILLLVLSVPIGYSSIGSYAYQSLGGDTTGYLFRQLVLISLGLSLAYIFHHFNYTIYFKNYKVIFWLSILLMILTYTFGREINGERRWFDIPFTGLTIQSSEVLKIAVIIGLSYNLSTRQSIINKLWLIPKLKPSVWKKFPKKSREILYNNTIPILGPIVLGVAIVLYNNLSTALIMSGTYLFMLILGRVRWLELLRLAAIAFASLVLIVSVLYVFDVGRAHTWVSRSSHYLGLTEQEHTPDYDKINYQVEQTRITVASGWKMGKGPGQSTQRANLPFSYSDYVFAVIVEEYGILGALIIISLYLLIFFRGIKIFQQCENSPFASMLVLGLSLSITLQALLHIGVSIDIAPATGQPLPLISKGGSSLIFTSIMFGMILGISRQINGINSRKKREELFKTLTEQWQQPIIETLEDEDSFEYSEKIKKQPMEPKSPYCDGVIWHGHKED